MTVFAKLATSLARNALGLYGTLVSSRLSILIFHRVHALPDSMFPDEPDARRFEALMRYVAATYRVMTLGKAIDHLAQGTLPLRSLVVTFDDGYADNVEVALPILQRLGMRATFFVATGFLDGGRMFNDSVIECLRASRQSRIDLGTFGLGQYSLDAPEGRRAAIDALLPRIKYLTQNGRNESISELLRLCDVDALPANLMMRSEQVRELHRAGMEIGAHTVNHPILCSIVPSEAEYEIGEGKRQLQSIIDADVDVFAYPNGKPDQDYDHCHVAMVRSLGFRGAVSTSPGVGRTGDDLFQLPRFTPWGRSIPVWAARLLMNQGRNRFSQISASRLPE